MNFTLTEEQQAFQELARRFADEEMLLSAKEWDEKNIFPIETLRKAAALGFASLYVSAEHGGTQLKRLDSALIFEELATACPSTAAYLSIHNMVAALIDHYGKPELRSKWLPKLCSMEVLSSYCLTEPSSGSDAASLKTTATRSGNEYILNGAKAFISGGSVSDLYVCMVRTGEEGPKGISCLLIEKDRSGLSFGKKEVKLGWHSQPTTMVFFENCRVPQENLIGSEGEGFKIALSALNGGRINIAACSLGGAKKCLALARHYMFERQQFKKKLHEFEALQFKFADLLTAFESARLLVYRAATALDEKDPEAIRYCAMAKLLATDNCFAICDEALQIFGGYGYLCDYPIERYFRDLRVHKILEGTNEIMRLIISRQAFAKDFILT
jgi:butyryl-CoA dehydrogenase